MPGPRQLSALVSAAGLALALSACGASDQQQVRATLARFGHAVRAHDLQQLCNEVLSPQLVEKVESVDLPCEVALRDWARTQDARLTVQRVAVHGARADARVLASAAGEPPAEVTVRLVKGSEGWRVAALAQPPVAASRPRGHGD